MEAFQSTHTNMVIYETSKLPVGKLSDKYSTRLYYHQHHHSWYFYKTILFYSFGEMITNKTFLLNIVSA